MVVSINIGAKGIVMTCIFIGDRLFTATAIRGFVLFFVCLCRRKEHVQDIGRGS